ncbi:unnamed protein product [Cylindrotheca closterium]|uniref:BTB domain-containing protein n=1 Tax=Cylindrotheca closterium TaxID=2856 RepID=A0AAD2JHN6_9STRA|nr:unnamed protein product [Cylindrotheca closterium]
MAEIFQEDLERQTRESLHSFLPMDDPYETSFGDAERHDHHLVIRQHPSRIPDTEMDVIMSPRISRSRSRLHQSYSKRQNLIKRGRALIHRGRGSKQEEESTDMISSVMSNSFSIDDGSYKDDLRRSILEEEASRENSKPHNCREGKYRKLKRELEQDEKASGGTSSLSTNNGGDSGDRSRTGLGHPPLHEKTERGVIQTASVSASHTISPIVTVHDASHSNMNADKLSSSRTRIQAPAASIKRNETKINVGEQQSVSSDDARQRTEERVLYLKQWLKDRDAQNDVATEPEVVPSAESSKKKETSVNTPPLSVTKPTAKVSPKQNKQISSVDRTPPPRTVTNPTAKVSMKQNQQISSVVRTPEAAGNIGISSGFPFPHDADITLESASCNVSELTTTISSKEQRESSGLSSKASTPVPPNRKKQPMTNTEPTKPNSLELTKSLDDMNQMLPPGPRGSNLPIEQQRGSKASPKTISTVSSEERNYLSSSRRKSEPLQSLLDSDSQEDFSIDRLQALDVFEYVEEKMSYPLDEPPTSKGSMPVARTYSKMSTLLSHTSSANSDGIRTIAQESRDEPPIDARSIACPDNESNESPAEPSCKVMRADDHQSSIHSARPYAKSEKGKIDGDMPMDTNTRVSGHEPRIQPITPISKTENEVVVEIKPPESDQVILHVSSSLTDSIQGRKFSPSRATSKMLSIPHGNKSTPSLRKSKRAFITPDGDASVDMSVSYKDEASFDYSKESVKKTDERIWRMDPIDSLADFILQIRDKGNGKSSTYHVHKHRLACGRRKSAHLDSLFKQHSTSSAHFLFCSKSCDVFPSVLDFMYCDDSELGFTTTSVVVYRWIGYELKIKALVAATTRFIHEDMQVSNMTSYVSDMENYGNLGMRKIMAEKCASKIEHISELDSLWILMDPDLFRDTVSCTLIDRTKTSQHLSILIAEYTALHKHEMSKAMFGNLTSSTILPKIAREAALPLLEICFSYGSPVEFEGLQKRCALTMATYWKITNENDRQRLFALLRNLPSSFSVDFLEKVNTGRTTLLLGQEHQNLEGDREGVNENEIEKDDTFSMGQDETEVIGWQLDPDLSYSDWVIRVKSGAKSSSDAYYVHKHVLAVGDHKSTFFASVFSSNRNQSITRGSTAVSLDQDAAQVFPRMLNFIYSKGKMLEICTQTIVPLRFLARTFQIYSLNQKIIEFVERDLCVDNVPQYLENADSFNDKGITAMVIDFVAANIEDIDIDSELLNVLEPSIFRRIISSEAIDNAASESYHVPILIAKYFFIHELDESLLEEIICTYDMDQLDCLNALKLLQIICRLEKKESYFFMTLRDKCTEVLTESWDDFRASFRDEVFAIMLTLDTETVAEIFDKVENRCYQNVEMAEQRLLPVEAVTATLEIPSEVLDFELSQERKGGSVIMPPSSKAAQFINQGQPIEAENRQPEPADGRLIAPVESMASAPSEEMRVSAMASAPSGHSEDIRVNTMASSPSKELGTSTMASAPPKEIVVQQHTMEHTTAPESCQIFSCGFIAAE